MLPSVPSRSFGHIAMGVCLASIVAVGGPGDAGAERGETLTFAGCDANVPITRVLARAFMHRHPAVRIELETVGSTNGAALAAAGVVHVGLVSRPLRPAEKGLGLIYLPYARTAVIIGADPDVEDIILTGTDLLGLYRGTTRLRSGGRELALLTREHGDSSVASLRENLPGFAEAYAAGSRTSHWTVLYSEPTMHEALLTVPFALGLTDLGVVTIERLPVRALAIDGTAPTLENLADGRYPFTKTLGLVWRDESLTESARAFVDFVMSEEAAGILTSHGYLPVR